MPLTPGEVMQLPSADELVLVSGVPHIRAKKVRYFEDRRFVERILPPPDIATQEQGKDACDDWSKLPVRQSPAARVTVTEQAEEDEANSGIRREPELPDHEAVAKETPEPLQEFAIVEDKPDELTRRNNALLRRMSRLARQASMHPGNELGL